MMDIDAVRDAVLQLLVLRPCHITGMHRPDHHLAYTCIDQKADALDRLLGALGITADDVAKQLHGDNCWQCHHVPSQEEYRYRLRSTYRWAGVEIPPALAALAPDGLRPGDTQLVLEQIPADGWTRWVTVAGDGVAATGLLPDRFHAALQSLIAAGAVETKAEFGMSSLRRAGTAADPEPVWTADRLEAAFHAALSDGDVKGVDAALRVMATVDPKRAQELFDMTKAALAIARVAR